MKRLEGKVALVTGGARGIGRAICEAYAREGARVAVADVLAEEANATAAIFGDAGLGLAMDVTDLASIAAGVAAVEARWGGVDILVNNAGVFNMASLDRITPEDYRRQFDINVGGTIFAAQAVAPIMRWRGGGAIINFSSQPGRRGEPKVTVYCATKAAVCSLGEALRIEWRDRGIAVCTLNPGVTATGFFEAQPNPDDLPGPDMDRSDSAEDVARHVLDLYRSPEAERSLRWKWKLLGALSVLFPTWADRKLEARIGDEWVSRR